MDDDGMIINLLTYHLLKWYLSALIVSSLLSVKISVQLNFQHQCQNDFTEFQFPFAGKTSSKILKVVFYFMRDCESKRNYLRGEWNHEKIITASWYCCLQGNFMYIGNTLLNDPHFWKFNIIGNFNFSIKNMWKDTSKIAFKEKF